MVLVIHCKIKCPRFHKFISVEQEHIYRLQNFTVDIFMTDSREESDFPETSGKICAYHESAVPRSQWAELNCTCGFHIGRFVRIIKRGFEHLTMCEVRIKFVCLVGFLTSSSTTRLYRGRAPRQSVWQFYVLPHMKQSRETMTSVSAGHIILTPIQPVGSGRPRTRDLLIRSSALYRLSYRNPPPPPPTHTPIRMKKRSL